MIVISDLKSLGNVKSCLLLEGLLYLCDAGVLFHHQEIGFSVFVQLSDPSEEESGTCVFIPYNGD